MAALLLLSLKSLFFDRTAKTKMATRGVQRGVTRFRGEVGEQSGDNKARVRAGKDESTEENS